SQKPITDARTFTFSSSLPISALAIRSRINERSEFMISALPIADLSGSSTANTSIPHVADGGGWATEILLVNTSDVAASGSMQFLPPAGQPLSVTLDGQAGTTFPYSIPARSSRRFRTAGTAGTAVTGWIEIVPSASTRTPSAAAVI